VVLILLLLTTLVLFCWAAFNIAFRLLFDPIQLFGCFFVCLYFLGAKNLPYFFKKKKVILLKA